jgi:hypothetical protein
MEIHKLRTHIEPFQLEYLNYHFMLVSASRLGFMKYLDVSTGQIVSEYKPKTKQVKYKNIDQLHAARYTNWNDGSWRHKGQSIVYVS